MKRNSLCSSLLAAGSLALLLGAAARPAQAQDAVVPLDTFTFDIAGFNSTSGVGYILGNDQTATFGTTQTFTGAGYNGQDITITSGETLGATTTTDTFTVTTPTNFLTSTTVSGTKITALQFDIGDANSGVTFGGVPDPVNVLLPISSYTNAGSLIYNTSTVFALAPATTLGTPSTSYSAVEGVNDGNTAISTLKVHSFTYSITYATLAAAPEPSQFAAFAIGGLGIGMLALRSRKRTA